MPAGANACCMKGPFIITSIRNQGVGQAGRGEGRMSHGAAHPARPLAGAGNGNSIIASSSSVIADKGRTGEAVNAKGNRFYWPDGTIPRGVTSALSSSFSHGNCWGSGRQLRPGLSVFSGQTPVDALRLPGWAKAKDGESFRMEPPLPSPSIPHLVVLPLLLLLFYGDRQRGTHARQVILVHCQRQRTWAKPYYHA